MYNYIVIENCVWSDSNFNTAVYPTVVEVKSLSGVVIKDDHYLVDNAKIGQLFIDGVLYNDLSNVPEESENSDFVLTTATTSDRTLLAREWRDGELFATDWIVPVTDHPQHVSYLAYREALRDWPSTVNFPETKPTITQ